MRASGQAAHTARIGRWFALCVLCFPPALYALDVNLLAPSGAAYQSFVQSLQSEALPSRVVLHVVSAVDAAPQGGQVWIALGAKAAGDALEMSDKPVLAVMLSASALRELKARYPKRRFGAIVLDQPASRQLALCKAILPNAQTLGLLLGEAGSEEQAEIERAAQGLGLKLRFAFLKNVRALVPVLENVMEGSDAVLAVSDRDGFSAQNARVILLTTYRAGLPLMAYSPSAVEAGALAAVFSTPENFARQVVEWLNRQKENAIEFPATTDPQYYDISLNLQVARSLRIDLPEYTTVMQRMQEAQR